MWFSSGVYTIQHFVSEINLTVPPYLYWKMAAPTVARLRLVSEMDSRAQVLDGLKADEKVIVYPDDEIEEGQSSKGTFL